MFLKSAENEHLKRLINTSTTVQMNKAIDCVAGFWHRKPPASEAEILQAEADLGIVFPEDYRQFLLWSNGGEAKIGRAYFSLWRVGDIARRNISASIKKYMSSLFVGVGTNGGDECYALDYSVDVSSPKFAIVPLGDLSHESKFFVGSSLTEAFEKSLNENFSDADYNSRETGPLTREILNIRRSNIMYEAEKLWQKKEYSAYIDILSRPGIELNELMRKKMEMAKRKIENK